VFAKWKPVLWFTKGPRRGRTLVPDVVRLEEEIPETPDDVSEVVRAKRDKSAHPWAQGDGGVRQWIHHLTAPGELIIDPFAGTGRWGEIAAEMGRRWIGCDITLGGTETVVADALAAD
jgi:DNA methylase